MHCEGVPNIIGTRSYATLHWLETGFLKQLSQCRCRSTDRQILAIDPNEKTVIWSGNRGHKCLSSYEIFIDFTPQGAMKGYPSRFSFERLHEQHSGARVNVTQMKLECLTEAKTCAIQKQEKCPI
jgi:hypothetical protein